MGSGDPSGLQNRRELALLALVGSTPTRFRHSKDQQPTQSIVVFPESSATSNFRAIVSIYFISYISMPLLQLNLWGLIQQLGWEQGLWRLFCVPVLSRKS